ncbi:MAG TPA: tetratricopeptide repeat protein [Candidatus Limnocylindrales bacterium]|nr:tetratricopeptide repeat protein [Candidatus Limnocylindrales bacterium]
MWAFWARALGASLLILGLSAWESPAQTRVNPEIEKAFHRGTDEMKAGLLEDAASDFSKVTKLDPSFAPAYFNLGLVRLMERHPSAAIEPLISSTKLSPVPRGTHLFLGIAYYRTNQYSKAIAALKHEVQLEPKNAEALMWLGVTQLADGDAVEAADVLDKAAQLKPGDVDILYHRGRAHMIVSKESYEQMLRADPTSWRVHEVLGESYLEADRLDDAISEYERAVAAKPTEPGIHEELGDAYWKKGELDKAEKSFQDELDLDPEGRSAMYKLAVVSLEHSEPERARTLLSRVIQVAPHQVDAEYQLGRAEAQLGQFDEAIVNFRAAIGDCGPTDGDTLRQSYYQLAQAYRRVQRPEESRAALESFMRLKKQADADEAAKLESKLKKASTPSSDEPEQQ